MLAHPMRQLRFFVLASLFALPAWAQAPALFGSSGKMPVFTEEELDRRFLKSKIYAALNQGTGDPACAHVLRGLLTVVAEIAPTIHKRDENFLVDPTLWAAAQQQLVSPRGFPGPAYVAAMVRKVLIDGKLPPQWLETATRMNELAPPATIDLTKLRFLADGVKPIDSWELTYFKLRERYDIEVKRATTAARDTAVMAFRDAYLDREVAWNNLTLVDLGPYRALQGSGRKGDRLKLPETDEPDANMASLLWKEPPPPENSMEMYGIKKKKTLVLRVHARLSPQQYTEMSKLPKGSRVLIRGRLWDMNAQATEFELRNALLFEDPDYRRGAFLVDPAAVAACPLAVNELGGIAPMQPGGFGRR
jgi:hypothetical protein